jgi:hypothetical protein
MVGEDTTENPALSLGEPVYRVNDKFDIAGYGEYRQRKQKIKHGKQVKTKKLKSTAKKRKK